MTLQQLQEEAVREIIADIEAAEPRLWPDEYKHAIEEIIKDFITQTAEVARKEGYEVGYAQAEAEQGLPKSIFNEIREEAYRECAEVARGRKSNRRSAICEEIALLIEDKANSLNGDKA